MIWKFRFRIQKSGSIEIEGVPDKVKASVEHSREKQKILCSSGPNPWSLLCHKEQLAKMHKSFQDSNKAHSKFDPVLVRYIYYIKIQIYIFF